MSVNHQRKKIRLISAKDEALSKTIFGIKGKMQFLVCNEAKVLKTTQIIMF